jgi:hypothetical protein
LAAFWQEYGTAILDTLTEYSGIPWFETDFSIYLVRFFPTVGTCWPLVIPLGGMRRGPLIEAAPQGANMKLDLIYQLSRRNLAQADWPEDSRRLWIADHPLMRPGTFRRDNLAWLVALVTAQKILGIDSTYNAFHSAFWTQRTPAREVLDEYLLGEWILTPDRPLAKWVADEPSSSRLVVLSRPPRTPRPDTLARRQEYIEGLPLRGRLGFSVRRNDAGQLVVDKIDIYRLAYASGLREGDVIRRVDGSHPRNHRDLVEKILATLNKGGTTLQIIREGKSQTVVLEPTYLPYYEENDSVWESYFDSLPIRDSLPEPADTESPQ